MWQYIWRLASPKSTVREESQLEVTPPPEDRPQVKRQIKDYHDSPGGELGDVLEGDIRKVKIF